MPYLLGNSFGDLGQQALAQETNRRLALAQGMGAFQQGMGAMQRAGEFETTTEMQRAQAEKENLFKQQEIEMRQKEIERQLLKDKISNELGQGYLKLGQSQLDWQKGQELPAQARAEGFQVNLAHQLAASGQATSQKDIEDLLPAKYKAFAPLLFDQSEKINDQQEQQHTWATGHASAINHASDINMRLADLTKQRDSLGYFGDRTVKKQLQDQIDLLSSQQKQIAPRAQAAIKVAADPRFAQMFAPDPEDPNKVIPTVPPSPRMQRRQSMNFINSFGPTAGAAAPDMSDAGAVSSPMTSTGTTSSAPAVQSAASAQVDPGWTPKYHPAVYSRASQLISQRPDLYDKRSAMQQALAEFNQSQAWSSPYAQTPSGF